MLARLVNRQWGVDFPVVRQGPLLAQPRPILPPGAGTDKRTLPESEKSQLQNLRCQVIF
jgi:hypothetical protein